MWKLNPALALLIPAVVLFAAPGHSHDDMKPLIKCLDAEEKSFSPPEERISGCTESLSLDVLKEANGEQLKGVIYQWRGRAYLERGDYEHAFADFDEAIRADPESPAGYFFRAAAHHIRGDYDRALVDYNAAIEHDEAYSDAYFGRGMLYATKNEYEQALTDYNEAVRLEPESSRFRSKRGLVNFYLGKFDDAAMDFVVAMEEDSLKPYYALLLYVSRNRSAKTFGARAELAASAGNMNPQEWPYPVIQLYLGNRTPEAVLVSADKSEDRCEAHFYIGQWHLMRAARAAALASLREAASMCPEDYIESTAARVDLTRLEPDGQRR